MNRITQSLFWVFVCKFTSKSRWSVVFQGVPNFKCPPFVWEIEILGHQESEGFIHKNILCSLPKAVSKDYLLFTCTLSYPHLKSHALRLGGAGRTHSPFCLCLSDQSLQACLGWLSSYRENIQAPFLIFPGTELVGLLRNLITNSCHGEIQLQPLPWWEPILLM